VGRWSRPFGSGPSLRSAPATRCQIDQLLYELYVLTDEEVEIVEEATR
jgi:hypothetical protein